MKSPRGSGRWLRLWGGVYVVLLAASFLVQLFGPARSAPTGEKLLSVEVAPQAASGPVAGEPVRVAYRDSGSGPPVIYLHGSPGSGGDADRLTPHLTARFRVIAPDLPGFGASTRRSPDYGIEAHARYVLAFMDELGIERAQFVCHSMGSGVGFHLARLVPDRVASIVAYAGIGVQEGEGSGDYHFEHLKYAVGYVALVVAPELVPHFGLLGPRDARHAFIRNFWDTDQRPVRGILEQLATPLLIVHGRRDPLVPAWAAEEHHRIVRHSELAMLDASHFMVFTRNGSKRLAEEILPFLERYEDPAAKPVRRTVNDGPAATEELTLPTDLEIRRGIGPWIQVGILIGATFVSEDLTCISAGLLARTGELDLFVAILGCVLGIFIGDVGLYFVGRWVGRPALEWRWISRRVPSGSVDLIGETLDRHLGKAVMASRFLPGTRLAMYVCAGIVSRRPVALTVWMAIASFLWTPLLVVLSMIVGPAIARPFEAVFGVRWFSWIVAAILLIVMVRVITRLASWRGRARLAATVSRLWRWEFWPLWLFYIPVVPRIAILALRHRGLMTPTAVNPALPHGGFVDESKHEILGELPREWVVPSYAVREGDPEQRLIALRAHAESNAWTLPLILKPDQGQRGVGLKFCGSWDEVATYLASNPRAVLAQTYHAGPFEAGIFYYRIPGESHGRIFSITDKRFPEVSGDGASTLETLILRDRRLRMQANTFLRRHADRLEQVPVRGERVRLAVAGNHCQGTMFCDGSHLATPELERSIDAIARKFDGFYFGRFDVRYADVEAFMAGRGFAIVELNGVTSESTNIYDPSWSLPAAYRTLWKQWSLAFRIGAANREKGHRTSSLKELLAVIRQHYRTRQPNLLAD